MRIFTHIFPLTWVYHFIRDIVARGAGFSDIASIFGMFLLYVSLLLVILYIVFFKARRKLLQKKAEDKQLEELNDNLVGEN